MSLTPNPSSPIQSLKGRRVVTLVVGLMITYILVLEVELTKYIRKSRCLTSF